MRTKRHICFTKAFVVTLSLLTSQFLYGSQPQWVVPSGYRISVVVDPGSSERLHTPVGAAIDFRQIFRSRSIAGRLDIHSIRIVRYHPSSGKAILYHGRYPGYEIPYRLTGDFPNEDSGIIWWRMKDNSATHFHIYFDSLADGKKNWPEVMGLVGVGDTFHYNDGKTGFAGNVALHSQYWHIDWDGDNVRDLIGFGYRVYEYGMPLEKELGNWVYFHKNIGTSEKPLFAPRYRVKGDGGQYLTTRRLAQNMFPSDWDGDGDIDFHGMDGTDFLLFENTGKRDRNKLWILKQPRVISQLKEESEFRGSLLPLLVPRKRGFSFRGERMVDWEGDGDLDLIASFRRANRIGEVDPRRGIYPYGVNLMIFELFQNRGRSENGTPVFEPPEVIRDERGLPLTSFSVATGGAEYIDYDGDGDRDLLFHDATSQPLDGGQLMFAENVGTREKPLFIMPIPLLQISDSPFFVDWNQDGRFDLVAGGEFFENVNPASGNLGSRKESPAPLGTYKPRPYSFPKFVSRGMAQQVHPKIMTYFTACVDWDEDGALDLVSGFHSNIVFYRNQGTTLDPTFCRGVKLRAGGKPIYMPNWLDPQAAEPAHWGPQGPSEPIYGWLNPTVRDWDSDGDLDLFVTGQRWQLKYFENTGTRAQPVLARGREVRCQGDPHEFSWRSKVSVGDLDGDGKAEFVVTSHQDNIFYMYLPQERQEDPTVLEVSRGPALTLEDGEPVKGWYGTQNNNGDNHSQLVDWDGDGDLDLINGSLWAVWYYENVGSPTKPLFQARGRFKAGGEVIHTFNHAGSFDAADWSGDGRMDLVMGTECPSDQPMGGVLHLFDRSFIENDLPSAKIIGVERR